MALSTRSTRTAAYLIAIGFSAVVTRTASADWTPEFVSHGLNDPVEAIAEYNGVLFAGGHFDTGGSYISYWDGSVWSEIGNGVDDHVYDLAVFESELYVAGRFTHVDGKRVNRIARWDGTTWRTVSDGANGPISALVVHEGALYVGGTFTTIDDIAASRIAKWNGTSWSSLGEGVDDAVWILESYRGQLYAGGAFSAAGGEYAGFVASWDGDNWSGLTTGVDNFVHSMTVWNDLLVIGGRFVTAGGELAIRVASWDGTTWGTMGDLDERPYTLHTYLGKVVAGGAFTHAGGLLVNHVAKWNGIEWSPMDQGTDGPVSELATFQGKLVAGGRFSTAGSFPLENIASWAEPTSSVDGDLAWPITTLGPNPVRGSEVMLRNERPWRDASVRLYDSGGRLRMELDLPDGVSETAIPIGALMSGRYYFVVDAQHLPGRVGSLVVVR